MPIIEGIGDEVTVFVTVLFILLGLLVAWLSSLENRPSPIDPSTTRTQIPAPSTSTNTTEQTPSDNAEASTENDRNDDSIRETNLESNVPSGWPSNEANTSSETDDGLRQRSGNPLEQIRIKLKYLDDRERIVLAKPSERIGQFKRAHFLEELAEDLNIRLIYNGQELRQENETLQSYNVNDNSVIHCLVSVATHQNANAADREHDHIDIDMSNLMFPLFGLILGLIWYCRITYRTFFNAMSTLALIGVSILFLFAVIITFRNQRRPDGVHSPDGIPVQ